jgi:hypothetical protein
MLAALGLSVAPVFHFNDPVFDTTLGFGEYKVLYLIHLFFNKIIITIFIIFI